MTASIKRRLFRLSVLGAAVLLIAGGCREDSEPDYGRGNFWALRARHQGSWYRVDAALIAEGSHCIIFAEKSQNISAATGQKIAEHYDTMIHEQITGVFGEVLDVDGNGKVTLLLLDIDDGYSPADLYSGYVGGYFQPDQMRKDFKFSNGADMLYIDTYPQSPDSPGFYATIAHELQHLIHYSETTAKGITSKDAWINEGLSTAAEYIYGEDPNDRINWTLRIQHDTATPISERKDTFYTWDGTLNDYSTAYLFFQWLRVQAKRGDKIYKKITTSPYRDAYAVLNAVKDPDVGFGYASSINDWRDLYRNWLAANLFYNRTAGDMISYRDFAAVIDQKIIDSGIPGISGLIKQYASPEDQKIKFKPGEAVYALLPNSAINKPVIEAEAYISFSYFASPSVYNPLVSSPPFGPGGLLIIYNSVGISFAQDCVIPKGPPVRAARAAGPNPWENFNRGRMRDLHFP